MWLDGQKFALSTDARADLAAGQPEKALDTVNRLQKIDPDYADLVVIRNQAEAMIEQQKIGSENRKKLMIWGGGIGGLIVIGIILFIIFNNAGVSPPVTPTLTPTIRPTSTVEEVDLTQTAKAIAVLSETPDPTATATATATNTPNPTNTPTPTPTSSPTPTATITPIPEETTLITAVSSATIFQNPDETSEQLTFVAVGEKVTILGKSENEKWLLVKNDDDIEGWVWGELFGDVEPNSTPTGDTTKALDSSSLILRP